MTVRALRYQLDTYHLDSTGRREVILKRLLQHLSSGAHPSPATGGNDSTAASSALPSGSHLTPAGLMTSQLPPQTPASLRTLNSPTPSPPQAPASPSMSSPAAPQPTVIVLGKGAAAISAKGATGARDNPLLSTNIPGIIPDDITHLADLAHHHPLQAVPHTGAVLADDTALALVTQPPAIAEVTGAADIITITLVPAIHHHHAI